MKCSFLLMGCMICAVLHAQEPRTESFLGNLAPIARSIQEERGFPLEYARRGDLSVDEWRGPGEPQMLRQYASSPVLSRSLILG